MQYRQRAKYIPSVLGSSVDNPSGN